VDRINLRTVPEAMLFFLLVHLRQRLLLLLRRRLRLLRLLRLLLPRDCLLRRLLL
jgi:hypothetical protein